MSPAIDNTPYQRLRDELEAHPRQWLVTGAAGFIGSHCVSTLLQLGQKVVALDSFVEGKAENLNAVQHEVGDDAWQRLRFIEGDIRDAPTCEDVVRDVDFVLHQAGLGSVPRSIEHPEDTHGTNVDGFVTLALAASRAEVKSMVYASSAAVYGDDPSLPKRESQPCRPMTPYAASKQINEVYAESFTRTYGLTMVGLRYFNVTGPRQDPNGAYASVVPRWLALLEQGQQPIIFGDGTATRDYCPVENVVQANLLAAKATPSTIPAVYNVGLGGQTDLRELYRLLRDGMARRGAPCDGMEPDFQPTRDGDITHSVADISAARRDLGYAPSVDLATGLERTMDWFRQSS